MIYLIRHMQSEANVKCIAGGDYPLTLKGINDAEILKNKINFKPDVFVVSPLIRARQTASILFPEEKFIVDDDFREIYFGIYENTLMADNEFLRTYNSAPSCLHEITHGDVLKERADKAIIKMLDYMAKGETVIICHDTLIRAILCRLKGKNLDCMSQYTSLITNGSIVELNLAGLIKIQNENDTTIL